MKHKTTTDFLIEEYERTKQDVLFTAFLAGVFVGVSTMAVVAIVAYLIFSGN